MSKSPLPTSASDIDLTDICCRDPLSSDDLRQIRSLIETSQPLTGRRVMVPITSKAFFEGELQPSTKDSGSISSNNNAAADERVVLNVGDGKLKEMTRTDACAFLDKQLAVPEADVFKSHTNMRKKSKPKRNLSFKKGFLNNAKNEVSNDSESTRSQCSSNNYGETARTSHDMFPLIEIREECDIRGNIVNSEVINMSNTMKRIDDRLKNVGGISNDNDDEKKLGKLLAHALKESDTDITTKVEEFHLEVEKADHNLEPTIEQPPVSDEDYEAILQRLDELERLEEEDDKAKKVNKTSSERLQSSGWSKGFLNAKKQETKTVHKGKEVKVEADVKIIPASTLPPQPEDAQVESNHKVSFSDQNEIKEIPRIGLNKVPQRSISFTNAANDAATDLDSSKGLSFPFKPISTVSFEDNVFRGVVKERNSTNTLTSSSSSMETTNQYTSQDDSGKKKLSRFAQQRLQRGR